MEFHSVTKCDKINEIISGNCALCMEAKKLYHPCQGPSTYDRGAGTYLNILWTNQVCIKLGVDKNQKQNIFMTLPSKIGHFQGLFPIYSVDKSPCPHMFRRPCQNFYQNLDVKRYKFECNTNFVPILPDSWSDLSFHFDISQKRSAKHGPHIKTQADKVSHW